MTQETVFNIRPEAILSFVEGLSLDEIDALKYQLSLAAVETLENRFEINQSESVRRSFFNILRNIHLIQPFRDRVPPYGIAYRGHPDFLTNDLLKKLQDESSIFRPYAVKNFGQFIYQLDTPDSSTVGEKLEGSQELLKFVTQHAGPCLPSYISSYIYYDIEGECSAPHVDNAFTGITVMIGLRHESEIYNKSSASVSYWPDFPRLDYQLKPGEISIFYGVSVLHGRTPVLAGELVHSMLLSFRPVV